MRTWKEPKLGTGRIRVRRDTWRTTICRLIRAEQELDRAKGYMVDMVQAGTNAGRQQGREDVLRLIARWGKARPLEGMGGADMAEALRKVLTPTIAPERYTSTEIEHLPHGQHVVTHKSEPEPAGNAAWEIEDYDWRPAGNGLEERKVTRTTMEFRSKPTGCDPK